MFTEYDIRLVGGSTFKEGRVEIFLSGFWGTICDDSWDTDDATVVCLSLGYPGRSKSLSSAHFGKGYGYIHMDNVECIGNEESLSQCSHNGWRSHDCSHKEDASVICDLDNKPGKISGILKQHFLQTYCI